MKEDILKNGTTNVFNLDTDLILIMLNLQMELKYLSDKVKKVGMGGHLMGQKVTDQVAEMRSLPSGIDQRSPARHPDWLGPDDLALKVEELRQLTKNKVPIQLKLGASKVYDDVRMAAKCDPDSIYLDGCLLYTSPSPRDATLSRMPSSA